MQEHELGDLGIFRIPIPIPFRQAGGPVNAYVIEEEQGFMLFDTGIGTDQAQAALAEGLARTGHRFEQLSRIVVSHGHVDHFGGASWISKQTGREIPILIHSAEANKVLASGFELPDMLRRNERFLLRLGVPKAVFEEMLSAISRNDSMGKRLAQVQPLVPGTRFQCKHVTLEVLHMPGHTPGVCCLYEPEYRIFFSADHLLERVSPNPLIELRTDGEPSSHKPLVSYFESLDRVRALGIDLVLPGHALPFRKCLEVIDTLSIFYERRQAKLLDALGRQPLTVYEAMRELFQSGTAFELFLMISETFGNLDMLEARGKIRRETDGRLIRFRLAG